MGSTPMAIRFAIGLTGGSTVGFHPRRPRRCVPLLPVPRHNLRGWARQAQVAKEAEDEEEAGPRKRGEKTSNEILIREASWVPFRSNRKGEGKGG